MSCIAKLRTKEAKISALWPFLNGTQQLRNPRAESGKRKEKRSANSLIVRYRSRLLRNFTSASRRGDRKRQKAPRFPVYDKRNGHRTKNGSSYNNNEAAFRIRFVSFCAKGCEGYFFRQGVNSRSAGERKLSLKGNFMFFISRTRTGNACVFRSILLFPVSPPLHFCSSVNGHVEW